MACQLQQVVKGQNKKKRTENCKQDDKLSFTPRDYQIEILECARRQNTIACLGTGTGKTFIAVMLIRENAVEVRKPFDAGGKRIFFLVPTVPLVMQQEKTIKQHADLKVRGYYGEMEVDSWEKSEWEKEFTLYEVLVMTAEIFRIILNHNFISLEKIQLLVFDECHRAQKDHPYRLAMKHISDQPKEVLPRIFGLSASLLNGKCKPVQLEKNLRSLEETLRSSITTASDITDIQKYGTDPDEYVVLYEESSCTSSEDLASMLLNEIQILGKHPHNKEEQSETKDIETKEGDLTIGNRDTDFFDKPKKSINQLLKILSTLGIWCAHKASEIFLKEVEVLCKRPFNEFYREILNQVREFLVSFMQKCKEKDFEINKKSITRSPHKLRRLLELFNQVKVSEKFKLIPAEQIFPTDLKFDDDPVLYNKKLKYLNELKKGESVPICSIVFVEQRITAYVLSHWIREVTQNIPGFEFIKPDFLVGHGTTSSNNAGDRDIGMSVGKQKKILKSFREKEVNVLVATSVLEEGMDIRQCNVVVRFDPPPEFRSYVQSKGRARAKDSVYVMFINKAEDKNFLQDMCNFKTIEKMLVSKCHNREMPDEEDIQTHMNDDPVSPYMPYGKNGPRIGLTSSISLINRYCSKLPCDMSTKLTPIWDIQEVDPEATKSTFICHLRMPINSPIKQTICSEEMTQRRLAKMSAALKACQLLHEIGELNENLVPMSELVDKALESEMGVHDEELCEAGVQPGTNRRRQIYNRKIPVLLSHAKPVANTPCYLHVFEANLAVPLVPSLNPRQRVLIDPSQSTRGFGILLTKKLPPICSFPIFTRSGKVLVSVKLLESALYFSDKEIQRLEDFHRFIFNDVMMPFEKGKSFSPDTAGSYYVTPVNKGSEHTSCEIDWDFINMTKDHDFNDQRRNTKRIKKTRFSESLFKNAVVLRTHIADTWDILYPTFHYVQRILYSETPNSTFENSEFKTYKGYYKIKYNMDIIYDDQPLIETVKCESIVMWKPIYSDPTKIFDYGKTLSKSKIRHKNYREYLVPELCLIHPFPIHMFEQARYLPTVLFRLHALLLAEELRHDVSTTAFVGTPDLKPEFLWPTFHLETSDRELNDMLVEKGELPKSSLTQSLLTPQDIVLRGSKIDSFEASVNLANHPGPCPSLLLQALTTKSAGDEFDLERLEVIGDSFLKYAMSIKIYSKYPQFDEGKLTRMRSGLICNLHLYQCAKKKGLAEYMVYTGFDCNNSWLPPCYDVEESVDPKLLVKKSKSDIALGTPKLHYFKQQIISDKCVADSVEALIGAYLLCCGQQGALRFMHWLGLNPLSKDAENVTEKDFENWLVAPETPIVTGDSPDTQQRLRFLTDGFEKFEKEINYKFKDRAYLLQAFTHPSYSYNDITDCYQRLEFIGDAILDYLITRQLYQHSKNYSPGELTDLRSALVNNIYFASLVVKHNYNKFLQMLAPTLFKLVNNYVNILENSPAFLYFKEHSYYLEEVECFELEEVEVPKALGDIFESVAGAIFFDSGMKIDAVWKVYEPLMKPAIDYYCEHLPISPVREMYELVATKFPTVKPKELFKNVVVKDDKTYIELKLPDGRKFLGIGPNKKVAKKSAAKRAIAEFKAEMRMDTTE